MKTHEVQRWMREHPRSIHGTLETIVARCSQDVCRQAARSAWKQAREIVDHEHHHWMGAHGGNHASPGFTACEVCANIANTLSHMKPQIPQGFEDQLLDDETRNSLEPDALAEIKPWLHDLAVKAEHDEWSRIVAFTRKRGRAIAAEKNLSFDTHWSKTWDYAQAACLTTEVLLGDYSEHTP
jgi:hypothetical protein